MPRKTTPVLGLLVYANAQLGRTDKFATKEHKAGVCSMIEHILMDSGNYSGFAFLDNSDSDTGTIGYYSRQYFYSNTMWRAAATNERKHNVA